MGAAFRSIAMAGAISLALSAPAALAKDEFPNELAERDGATRLEPVSSWNLDFGENRCQLARWFGTEEEPHLLVFEQAAPSGAFGISIGGPQLHRFDSSRRLTIGMERDEPARQIDRLGRAEMEGVGPSIIIRSFGIGREAAPGTPSFAGIDLDEASTVDRIVVKAGGRILSLETGNMMPPFQALNTCTSDLLRVWGLDAEKHVAYTRPRWTNESAIVRQIVRDYPSEALAAREQGLFRMRVIVEEDGSVSDCLIQNSTRVDRLESPACQRMMRAEFEPARDAEGNPMRSFFSTTITYALN